jgi:hypothetical protein
MSDDVYLVIDLPDIGGLLAQLQAEVGPVVDLGDLLLVLFVLVLPLLVFSEV